MHAYLVEMSPELDDIVVYDYTYIIYVHTWMHLHSIYGFTLPKKLKQRDLFFVEVLRGEMKPRIESVIK